MEEEVRGIEVEAPRFRFSICSSISSNICEVKEGSGESLGKKISVEDKNVMTSTSSYSPEVKEINHPSNKEQKRRIQKNKGTKGYKHYDTEIKERAIKMIKEGVTPKEVSQKLGVYQALLNYWVKKSKQDSGSSSGICTTSDVLQQSTNIINSTNSRNNNAPTTRNHQNQHNINNRTSITQLLESVGMTQKTQNNNMNLPTKRGAPTQSKSMLNTLFELPEETTEEIRERIFKNTGTTSTSIPNRNKGGGQRERERDNNIPNIGCPNVMNNANNIAEGDSYKIENKYQIIKCMHKLQGTIKIATQHNILQKSTIGHLQKVLNSFGNKLALIMQSEGGKHPLTQPKFF